MQRIQELATDGSLLARLVVETNKKRAQINGECLTAIKAGAAFGGVRR